MRTLTTQDYAAICKKSYNEKGDLNPLRQGAEVKIPVGSQNLYKVHLEKSDAKTDFQGYLLEKLDSNKKPTGEFVTVFRGSHSGTDWQGNMDVLQSGKHDQTQIAMAFAKEARDKANELSNGKFSMVNTGHSLGGAEAQLAHLVNNAPVVTFNPLPATLFKDENGKKFSFKPDAPIENHVMALDVASPLVLPKDLPGSTKMYARPENIAVLAATGHGQGIVDRLMVNRPVDAVLIDAAMGTSHSIDHFNGKNSVLSKPDFHNITQNDKFSPLIHEWRDEVFLLNQGAKAAQLFRIASGALEIPNKYQEIKDGILEKKNQINQIINNIHKGVDKINDFIDFFDKFDFRRNLIPNLSEQNLSPSTQKLFQQYDEKFTALCEKRGITADCKEDFENLRGAAIATALTNDLPNIEKVDIDSQTRTLWLGSYNPRPQVTSLSVDEAVNIPMSESMAKIHTIEQQNAQQAQERQMAQSQQQNHVLKIG